MKAAELRQSILQAAVQGRLIPQDSHDEPASELLKRIQEEKVRLVSEGKIKKDKPLPLMTEDETPYDLPEGWVWCRLGGITLFIATGPFGSMLHKSDYVPNGIPLVNPANMKDGKIYPSNKMMINEATRSRMSSYVLHVGDVVIARRGDLGRCAVVSSNGEGWICGTGSFFLRLAEHIHTPFFLKYFQSTICRNQLNKESVGSTMSNLNHTILKQVLFPLPSLAEQQRIVAKVDELMALCDELEVAEKELDALENRLAEYLPKSILQAAAQGKLVPQDVHDEPASELLKRIQREKERLVNEGTIKKEKPLPPVAEDDVPYDLPEGWVWCRLGNICYVNMGQSPDGNSVSNENAGIEFHQGKSCFSKVFLGESPSKTTSPTKIADCSDILLAVRAPVGVVNITMRKICIGRGLCALQKLSDVDSKFLFYFMCPMEEYFNKQATGTTFRAISAEIVKNALFPLPPLAEQQRIVAKVDELMLLCEELKNAKVPVAKPDTAKIIPFPQHIETDEEINIAARGDGSGGLSEQAWKDATELLGGGVDE